MFMNKFPNFTSPELLKRCHLSEQSLSENWMNSGKP